jgi:hypothetical protein
VKYFSGFCAVRAGRLRDGSPPTFGGGGTLAVGFGAAALGLSDPGFFEIIGFSSCAGAFVAAFGIVDFILAGSELLLVEGFVDTCGAETSAGPLLVTFAGIDILFPLFWLLEDSWETAEESLAPNVVLRQIALPAGFEDCFIEILVLHFSGFSNSARSS